MKIRFYILITVVLSMNYSIGQNTSERFHRIRKSQMPIASLRFIEENLDRAKRFRFYKEIDTTEHTYTAKFKKDRLWYQMNFDDSGTLTAIEILIKPIDIPSDVLTNIEDHFGTTYRTYKVKEIRQQYLTSNTEPIEKTLRNAFQNLLLPALYYNFIITGKKTNVKIAYEVLFDADGNFNKSRQRLPPNYDRVLY